MRTPAAPPSTVMSPVGASNAAPFISIPPRELFAGADPSNRIPPVPRA
ncbi:unannotated protein [freshwater metagenome]|uniref:Unannotated protein n=1 Tax=freshwater metagenome TaxID=449393 RepID=A0A6J6JQE7_9ZZZZ